MRKSPATVPLRRGLRSPASTNEERAPSTISAPTRARLAASNASGSLSAFHAINLRSLLRLGRTRRSGKGSQASDESATVHPLKRLPARAMLVRHGSVCKGRTRYTYRTGSPPLHRDEWIYEEKVDGWRMLALLGENTTQVCQMLRKLLGGS